jgi:natural product precursor
MKKLEKLQINPEKLMKNEELKAVRGGYDPCTCMCFRMPTGEPLGYLVSEWSMCEYDCFYAFGYNATGQCWT